MWQAGWQADEAAVALVLAPLASQQCPTYHCWCASATGSCSCSAARPRTATPRGKRLAVAHQGPGRCRRRPVTRSRRRHRRPGSRPPSPSSTQRCDLARRRTAGLDQGRLPREGGGTRLRCGGHSYGRQSVGRRAAVYSQSRALVAGHQRSPRDEHVRARAEQQGPWRHCTPSRRKDRASEFVGT